MNPWAGFVGLAPVPLAPGAESADSWLRSRNSQADVVANSEERTVNDFERHPHLFGILEVRRLDVPKKATRMNCKVPNCIDDLDCHCDVEPLRAANARG